MFCWEFYNCVDAVWMAVIHYSSSLKDFGLAHTITTGKLRKLFTVCYFETLRTKQSIYVIWLWLSSLHSYTSSTSQIIRTKERKWHHVDWWSWANDYLSFTSSIRWRLLVIGRRMLCKSFEVQKPQGEFSSMKEIFKENWGKKIKIKTKQNEHAVRSRLVIGGLV